MTKIVMLKRQPLKAAQRLLQSPHKYLYSIFRIITEFYQKMTE